MKKLIIGMFAISGLILSSCGNNSGKPVTPVDSVKKDSTFGPDSAANNGILPPSGAPGNAGNSSLADTTYKATDSSKSKK
jgi:hypothetical protein